MKILENVKKSVEGGKTFRLDRQIFTDKKSFKATADRYRDIGLGEVEMSLGHVYWALSAVDIAVSYNLNDYPNILEEWSKSLWLKGRAVTKEERMGKIRNHGKFLTARGGPEFAKSQMANAYTYMQYAISAFSRGWKLVKEADGEASILPLLTPEVFGVRERNMDLIMANLVKLASSKEAVPFTSAVTGEIVYVNVAKFFADAPNLRDFLPLHEKSFDDVKRPHGFLNGRVTKWDDKSLAVYKKYLSVESGYSQPDLPIFAIRSLSESFEGGLITKPMAYFVR